MLALALALQLQAALPTDSVVARATAAVTPLSTPAALQKARYLPLQFGPVRDNGPFQGQHWLDAIRIATNQPIDLSHPSFVMVLPVRDSLIPIGVAYSALIGQGQKPPATLAGNDVEWHEHQFCGNVPGEGRILADGTQDCLDRGGRPTPMQIGMVHTWTIPNPDGPYAHDNPTLPFLATQLKAPAMPDATDRKFALALAETYGARAPAAHRINREAGRDGKQAQLTPMRDAIAALIPQLQAAEKKNDTKAFASLRTQAIAQYDALVTVYKSLASTPQIASRLDLEIAQMTTAGHHHH
jgi:hypothetical protein